MYLGVRARVSASPLQYVLLVLVMWVESKDGGRLIGRCVHLAAEGEYVYHQEGERRHDGVYSESP
jgi:hypothetical protein